MHRDLCEFEARGRDWRHARKLTLKKKKPRHLFNFNLSVLRNTSSMKPPHPPPATFTPCSSLSPLLHTELHHHARFHLHTKSTATFHCPPPCLPPALSHLPSAHEKAEEQDGGAAVQKLARPLHSRTSHYFFSGSRWEPGEGWHLDKCPLEVFLLSSLAFWWWVVLERSQNQNLPEKNLIG